MNIYQKVAEENAGRTFYLKENGNSILQFSALSVKNRGCAWEHSTPVGTIIGYSINFGLIHTPSQQMEETYWAAGILGTLGSYTLVVPETDDMRGFYWSRIDDIVFGTGKKEIESLIKVLGL